MKSGIYLCYGVEVQLLHSQIWDVENEASVSVTLFGRRFGFAILNYFFAM